jgi:hypothetical protein
MYVRCGNSEFPQTVNNHSAEISENMEKFSKSSTIQIGLITQKVSQGILETQKFTNHKKKAIDRFTSLTIIGMMKIMCNSKANGVSSQSYIT